ncbi:MAG: hypothetical protein JWO80_4353, partial [Bryobacterales bacterium]|nr:hypothetical protein [Bryobacterales bacterium]
ANGRVYNSPWVVLMDQPFSPLVKELFEAQHYPDLRTAPNGPPIRPYDVAGWTLPMQMGVEVDAVLQPVAADQRTALRHLEVVTPPAGSVQGTGAAYTLSHKPNASFAAVNDVLAQGGKVAFQHSDGSAVITGLTREQLSRVAATHSAVFAAAPKLADALTVSAKPRVGLYRAWVANIDEGWTRWILADYSFAPVTLRNGDIQAGHLRDHFDAIILPDSMPKPMTDGFAPGTVPGLYAGGIGDSGIESLREFVGAGGTLIALNNASLFAINALSLPVTNILGALNNDQFYCSGSLLRIELKEPAHPALWGLPPEPIVMFERGPAFETKAGFRGNVLATYPKDRNPLASGYLLHPEQIQGKAAALEVFYGSGRVYLFGFRPQWRGQSHGGYKFVFNAIYDSPAVSKPTAPSAVPADVITPEISKIHTALSALLDQNRAFFSAKGAKAIEEKAKLNAAVDQFQRDTVPVQPSVLSTAPFTAQLRKLSEDLRTKEFDASQTTGDLLEKYGLARTELDIYKSVPKN